MSKRLIIALPVAAVLLVGIVFLEPTGILRGYLNRESFFGNRPTRYWRQALGGSDPAAQEEAVKALKEGGPLAVPVLVELLKGKAGDWKSAQVRWKAADLLGRIGAEARDAVPALVDALTDNDPHVRAVSALALAEIGTPPPEAVPTLTEMVGGDQRLNAIKTLSRYGHAARPAVVPLIEALKDPDADVRWNAARTLGKIGLDAKESVPALIAALKDEDAQVREHAAESLGQIGPAARSAVPELINALQDPDWRVRKDAARSLSQIGPEGKTAVPALRELLKDPEQRVRDNAGQALRVLDPDSRGSK